MHPRDFWRRRCAVDAVVGGWSTRSQQPMHVRLLWQKREKPIRCIVRAASTCAPAGRDVRIVLRDVVSFEILNVQTYILKHRNASWNGARRAPFVFGFRFLTVIVETVDKLKRSLHLAVSSEWDCTFCGRGIRESSHVIGDISLGVMSARSRYWYRFGMGNRIWWSGPADLQIRLYGNC